MKRIAVVVVTALCVAAATGAYARRAQSRTEANKALVRRFVKAMNTFDTKTVNEVMASNWVLHTVPPAKGPQSRAEFLRGLKRAKSSFPDGRYFTEDQIAEGDKVVTRSTWRGTHKGEWENIPPTGKQVAMVDIGIDRIVNGTIVESWAATDELSLMRQIGGLPSPQGAGP